MGDQVVLVNVHGTELVAEAMIETPVENVVTLHTPEPVSPRSLRGTNDDRRLGLAIAVYPWTPPNT